MKTRLVEKLCENAPVSQDIKAWVGIDVSKASLDVCVLRTAEKARVRKFNNSREGFGELLKWCESLSPCAQCHFCMESTGVYSFGIASHLADQGRLVSVVNPRTVKYFGIGENVQNKTDKVDAAVIAHYCRQKSPGKWELADPRPDREKPARG